jgi:hypothetical protein
LIKATDDAGEFAMKAGVLFLSAAIISMVGCANVSPVGGNSGEDSDLVYSRENAKFSDTGAVSAYDSDYGFTILLVKDLARTLESLAIADYGLPYFSRFKRSETVTPYLSFISFTGEEVDLTYSVKLQNPGGEIAAEYNNLRIERARVSDGAHFPAKEFATVNFDSSHDLGNYNLYITIRDRGNIKTAFNMRFELTE